MITKSQYRFMVKVQNSLVTESMLTETENDIFNSLYDRCVSVKHNSMGSTLVLTELGIAEMEDYHEHQVDRTLAIVGTIAAVIAAICGIISFL